MAAVPNAIMANNDVQMVQMTASEPSASAAASATTDVTSNATSNATNNATSGGLTLRRGMKLRCYIPACGWIENNGKKLILFVIAIKNMAYMASEQGGKQVWRIFRCYSHFVNLRKELLEDDFACDPLPVMNVTDCPNPIEARRACLEKWIQSIFAWFDRSGTDVLDSVGFAKFVVHQADKVPAG